ncbi:MAG: MerR family transcriptional regulator [Dehalococcoidia bacterium]
MNETLSISDAAERSGLTAHTIRYYESAGLLPRVGRASSGHRRFAEADVTWAIFITRLRATGMPIRQIKEYVDLFKQGPSTEGARLALLEEHRDRVRERLEEISQNLALIETKIEAYKTKGLIAPALPNTRN